MPVARAALLQLVAAVPVLAGVYVCRQLEVPLPLWGAALLQGAVAALLTLRSGLAPWWRPIQLMFPIALLFAQRLHAPPPLLFGLFALLLLVFWSTFRTQVPYYPSGAGVWRGVAELLPPDRSVRLIDVGSGLGGLVLDLARRRPDCECTGVELAPLPWLVSALRARLSGSSARFVRGDYRRLDLGDYDIVFAFLSPAAMPALWRQAQAQLRPAGRLISCEFEIPGQPPDETVATPSGRALHVWRR